MGVTHSLLIGVSRSEKQYEIIATTNVLTSIFVMAASSNRNTGARGRANTKAERAPESKRFASLREDGKRVKVDPPPAKYETKSGNGKSE